MQVQVTISCRLKGRSWLPVHGGMLKLRYLPNIQCYMETNVWKTNKPKKKGTLVKKFPDLFRDQIVLTS